MIMPRAVLMVLKILYELSVLVTYHDFPSGHVYGPRSDMHLFLQFSIGHVILQAI